MDADYYKILGIAKNSDQGTIKKAYRRLAMKFHPDQNPGDDEAEDKFKAAAQAYEVLSNPEQRARYDQFGHAGLKGFGGRQGFSDINDIFSSFSDIFGDFFGGDGGRGGPSHSQSGASLRYVLDVSLAEVVEGIEKTVEFHREGTCQDCGGNGAKKGTTPITCPQCNGKGQVVRSQGFFSVATTCMTCEGAGQIVKTPCSYCRGQGRVKSRRQLKVKVPAGVETGTRLRVVGEGEAGYNGGRPGDLYVEIRVEDQKDFVRQGNDLYAEVRISYLKAILGAQVEAKTISGTRKIDIEPGTQPGEKICLRGEGIPSLRGYGQGDLYYVVQVEIPDRLTKDENRLLREIADLTGDKVKGESGFFKRRKKGKGIFH